jgi:hypothetical protein
MSYSIVLLNRRNRHVRLPSSLAGACQRRLGGLLRQVHVQPRALNKRKAPGNRHSGDALSPGSYPKHGSFYRSRDHVASPFFKIVRDRFNEFERVYPERFQQRYGYWRPVIRSSIDKFLKCEDLKEGFARVKLFFS